MSQLKQEFRMLRHGELRADSDSGRISGYAAVFNTPSSDLGGFTEVVKPGAFSRCLQSQPDVCCFLNHDPNLILGRTRSKTLNVSEDRTGLFFGCSLSNSSTARDLLESVKRGDIQGASFGFVCKPGGDAWPKPDRRELLDVDVFDCGPVSMPAYSATSVSARSTALQIRSLADPKKFHPLGVYDFGIGGVRVDEDEIERLRLQLRIAQLV